MKPRVLYVTPIFGYPALGGPRLRTYNTLLALARCADVSLYLTAQPDTSDRAATRSHLLTFLRDVVWPAPPTSPPNGLVRRLARAVLPETVRAAIRRRRASDAEAPVDSKSTAPALLDDLESWIAEHRPDVIWLGFGGISYDLVPLKERTGLPLVLETECVWSRFILRELPFAADPARRAAIQREGVAKEAEERRAAQHVDVTTAVSEVDADYFRALAPDPSSVVQVSNVVDVAAYQADAPRADLLQPAFVFAGSLSRGTANVDATCWLVDEILPRVWAKRPDVHLYLVGRDPAPEVAARRSQRVHVTGEVPSIVPYLRGCAAAVVPLRWESGTRFKILEAFACGAPVISTTLGAEGLAVEHDVHLLLADGTEAFALAMLRVVEEAAVGERLMGPAFELVRREYDISSAERQVASVLARIGVGDRASV
ncbi:MAG TPA: glycosyltransferase family 4 protein [Chloroflexota bacterium]|jgi:glycosyltransferase involved in cell wall biosynthesis